MIDVVLSPEAARLREQLRNGGMLPASAPVETVEPLGNDCGKGKPVIRKPDSVGRVVKEVNHNAFMFDV